MSQLAERTVVVLGASSGIGLAIAQAVARQDARVILMSRSLESRVDLVLDFVGGETLETFLP
jgi:NAD(P)-dependent dehydrogenase (short-subunit alcohol dehydrogenase family)